MSTTFQVCLHPHCHRFVPSFRKDGYCSPCCQRGAALLGSRPSDPALPARVNEHEARILWAFAGYPTDGGCQ